MLHGKEAGKEGIVAEGTAPRLDVVVPIHVVHQGVLARERLGTDSAGLALDAGVALYVAQQIRLIVEFVVAIITVVVAGAVVARLVLGQVGLLGKGPAAKVAGVRLLFAVHAHHVTLESAALGKGIAADVAGERFLASVNSLMGLQGFLLGEAGIANLALEGFQADVRVLVTLQIT